MKLNRKFFSRAAALALALIMAFSLAGCSEEDQELIGAVIDVADAVLSESDGSSDSEEAPPQEPEPEIEEGSCVADENYKEPEETEQPGASPLIDEDGVYTSKEDIAEYLIAYGRLPKNFITKSEARKLGWEGGGLDRYAKDKCIGGDSFGNREGLLPDGYRYIECDVDTLNKDDRGAKRIVFSEDCSLIYYTPDHYGSFTLLYGEE